MSDVVVSYSQFSMYMKCPWKWKLTYIDKHKDFTPNIHLVFGTAMHQTIQDYLNVMFLKSIKEADAMDLESKLHLFMVEQYKKLLQDNGGLHFVTKEDMKDFYVNGLEIIKTFKKHRINYFNRKTQSLKGIEYQIKLPTVNPNVNAIAYLDVLIQEGSKYTIYDLKTSSMGWGKFAKSDESKTMQLVLYKNWLARSLNIPLTDIDINYLILKLKLYENVDFPQKRIQSFVPPSGTVTMNRIEKNFNTFVNDCFKTDGSYNTDTFFAKNINDCKFCPFKDKPELCSKNNG